MLAARPRPPAHPRNHPAHFAPAVRDRGLAAAPVGSLALAGPQGYAGLQLGSLLLGAWLIISPFVLDQKCSIAHPMYWSNSWAGGVLVATALVGR
jgi:hypothetical protein